MSTIPSSPDYDETNVPSDVSLRAQSDTEQPSWHIRLSNISTKSRAAQLTANTLAYPLYVPETRALE
ncbi:uncharacterized protein BJ212DRAFT_1474276 [Suillus subaureus]|uniref:Uncharacterized protein n=1 Tax=Suillus subaureus TaxID=48587 RepID=A0A9P7EP89_9AGAM|nr:uncharacterized protein BJ212DRAFT_1474276 [Suillus subaureus]KAG1827089.1 hypothetical protein BJ212DRAFT_1474276 [Suillus subaureus]